MFAEEIKQLSASEEKTSIELLLPLIASGRLEMPPEPLNLDFHIAQVMLLIQFLYMVIFRLESHISKVKAAKVKRHQPSFMDSADWHMAQTERIIQQDLEAKRKEAERDAANAAALKEQQQRHFDAQEQTLRMLGKR